MQLYEKTRSEALLNTFKKNKNYCILLEIDASRWLIYVVLDMILRIVSSMGKLVRDNPPGSSSLTAALHCHPHHRLLEKTLRSHIAVQSENKHSLGVS